MSSVLFHERSVMHPCLRSAAALLLLIAYSGHSYSQVTAAEKAAVDESFDGGKLDTKVWKVGVGDWKQADGVLKGAERPADKHAAALRRVIETKDADYELKFRFTESGKGFHFGFDPAKGELPKKGHLFSVVITRESWKIMRHADKRNVKAHPNKNLAVAKAKFETGQWYSLKVMTRGEAVTARINEMKPLEASDPEFAVRKPTLVFRCLGDGVEIDDLKVSQKPSN